MIICIRVKLAKLLYTTRIKFAIFLVLNANLSHSVINHSLIGQRFNFMCALAMLRSSNLKGLDMLEFPKVKIILRILFRRSCVISNGLTCLKHVFIKCQQFMAWNFLRIAKRNFRAVEWGGNFSFFMLWSYIRISLNDMRTRLHRVQNLNILCNILWHG